MVDALNSFVTDCLDRHTRLKKVKVTRPHASWMASDEIRELDTTRDKLRAQARCRGTDETWTAFRTVRNRINAVIGKAKRAFLNTAFSSKQPREVWFHPLLHYYVSPKNLASFRTLPQLFSTVSQPMSETLRTMVSFANQ